MCGRVCVSVCGVGCVLSVCGMFVCRVCGGVWDVCGVLGCVCVGGFVG